MQSAHKVCRSLTLRSVVNFGMQICAIDHWQTVLRKNGEKGIIAYLLCL